jgi:hypothetical protein
MEPGSSLLCSQEPSVGPCSYPVQFKPHLTPNFFKINFNIILPVMPVSLKWPLPLRLSDKNFVQASCKENIDIVIRVLAVDVSVTS